MKYVFGKLITFDGRLGTMIDSEVIKFPHRVDPVEVVTVELEPTRDQYGSTVNVYITSPLLRER